MSWLNSITALVSSDELATDVGRAESLLEHHQVMPKKSNLFFKILESFLGAACGNRYPCRWFSNF